MYSVLIQNQKTIQIFREYYPIFLDLFSKNQIGCCRWVESGRTIDTALPGLNELVGEKEEWRAVIVRMIEQDEHDMQKHPSQPENPYDFKENTLKKNARLSESGIPLVRLTQMLGEVPSPLQTFSEEVRKEPTKAPRRVYVPDSIDKKEVQTYRELVEKYEYDGHKPSDVIIITLTCVKHKNDRRSTELAWNYIEEEAKSDFARRNWYSSNCRFVQYQYVKEGRVRKEADLFNFWNCVMLLASDNIDPSSLQAHRLYTVHVDFNMDEMADVFQTKYDELMGCRNYVEEEMRRDIELRMNEKHPKPNYRASITAEVEIPKDTKVSVDTNLFHLCPRSTNNEMKKWDALRDIAEDSLETIFRNQDRVLDESANQMRKMGEMPESLVTPLDKYEKIDMEADLSWTFDEILRTQNTISDTRNVSGKKISSLAEDVRNYISGRLPRPLALEIAIALAIITLLSVMPAFVIKSGTSNRHIWGIIASFLFCGLGLGLCELFVLLYQKGKLIGKMEKYNDAMEDNLSVLTQDMKFYSNFVSNIVSFSRGRSFLNTLQHKKFKLETEYDLLQHHLDEIDIMISKVEKWSKAFFIPITPKRNIGNEYIVEIEIGPRNNKLYTFCHNEEHKIPLNYTGDEIISPFSFIERLIIEREELYKDAGRDD